MACPLARPQTPGRCNWCRKALKGRQKRWCSRECVRTATANHRWTQAKAVKKLEAAYFLCANAGMAQQPDGTITVIAVDGCEGLTEHPEVNHIVPCLGKHGTWGCHHHQSNLEVLCPPCHAVETKQQAAARAAQRRKDKT